MRFQQTTPAVSAKGVEDTAFYRYLRLLALNEVGGDPERFGLPLAEFHAANLERAAPVPARPAGDLDPRHQALGRQPRADRGAGRDGRALARARARWHAMAAPLRDEGAPDGPGPDGGGRFVRSTTRPWSACGRSSPGG